jgi:hypothetical protein
MSSLIDAYDMPCYMFSLKGDLMHDILHFDPTYSAVKYSFFEPWPMIPMAYNDSFVPSYNFFVVQLLETKVFHFFC